jgi:acetolactate synthase regulatory subunit
MSITTTFDLEVTDDPAALVRVLVTLQRRRCRITAVDYQRADRHRPAVLRIAVQAPPSHAHRVGAWLRNLVDVLAVTEIPAAGRRRSQSSVAIPWAA